ncbi:hypothetical protein LPJ66_004922 [Kickxella alabastrina]|uniref:Uncharacterized protein n=1 Tax=Kickxella alabastrina TaxID=61397 RepID=A0ACC1IK12_9FUNG|nr:hypothetical protein LPJ66_004922 [Kickxella alabastrina]
MKVLAYFVKLALVAPLFAGFTHGKLEGCSKSIAIDITGIYENGDTKTYFHYCEDLGDGRGYTAGIAGFCTGTGDAWEVIQAYHKLTGGKDDFTPMDATLAKYAKSGSDSTKGLEKYCSVFEKLGKSDTRFQQVQINSRDKMYLKPAQDAAAKLGLKFHISEGQLFDTSIQHGPYDDKDGLLTLIKETNNSFKANALGDSGSTLNINGKNVDEIIWLKKFLDIREEHLKHPKNPDNQGGNYWAQTVYRVKSYRYAIDQKQYNWGNTAVKILDNDGKPTTVKCSNVPK